MRHRSIDLPGRGQGALAALELGAPERRIDLVFLHANGFNALTYRRILQPLAGEFRILAVDQRGHGASSLPTDPDNRSDWHDFRDDLIAVMETLDLQGVVLSGHSLGGTAALLAAAASGDRTRRLLLFDPVVGPRRASGAGGPAHSALIEGARRRRAEFPSRATAFEAYRGRGAFASWPDNILADYVEAGFRDLPGGAVTLACEPAWEASTFLAQGSDPWAALAAAPCPVEIVKAERNSTCHLGEETFEDGAITVETVAGTSHFLPMERPRVATERLRRALAGR